jgi:hypothetical protein
MKTAINDFGQFIDPEDGSVLNLNESMEAPDGGLIVDTDEKLGINFGTERALYKLSDHPERVKVYGRTTDGEAWIGFFMGELNEALAFVEGAGVVENSHEVHSLDCCAVCQENHRHV